MSEDRAEHLSEAFWSVARQLRQRSRETFAPLDVSPSQARALRMLSGDDLIRLSELAERLRIAPRSTTEIVDSLCERTLLERLPDPKDRRATLVRLTASGVTLTQALQAARRADAREFFGRLSVDDQRELSRILSTLQAEPHPATAGEPGKVGGLKH